MYWQWWFPILSHGKDDQSATCQFCWRRRKRPSRTVLMLASFHWLVDSLSLDCTAQDLRKNVKVSSFYVSFTLEHEFHALTWRRAPFYFLVWQQWASVEKCFFLGQMGFFGCSTSGGHCPPPPRLRQPGIQLFSHITPCDTTQHPAELNKVWTTHRPNVRVTFFIILPFQKNQKKCSFA